MHKEPITEHFKKLQEVIAAQYDAEALAKIEKAFHFQLAAYPNTHRPSGEHYLVHNIGLAYIVASEMNLEADVVIAALLHNYLHHPVHQLSTITTHFGPAIATTLQGLHELYQVPRWEPGETISYLKTLHAICKPAKSIVFIALADQLNKLRNLKNIAFRQHNYNINLTKHIYTSLAHRLGLPHIKIECEDLCLRYTDPYIYYHIANKLRMTKRKRNQHLNLFTQQLTQCLDAAGYQYFIKQRTKSIFSIWHKMQQGISFENIYDLSAVRIITNIKPPNDIPTCFAIYETIKANFELKAGRYKNFIENPKANGYQSLHLTVINAANRWTEVQIRTKAMDKTAEKGKAAHWQYKNMQDPTQNIPAVSQWLESITKQSQLTY